MKDGQKEIKEIFCREIIFQSGQTGSGADPHGPPVEGRWRQKLMRATIGNRPFPALVISKWGCITFAMVPGIVKGGVLMSLIPSNGTNGFHR